MYLSTLSQTAILPPLIRLIFVLSMERLLARETVAQEGGEVRIQGWVHARRNMGKIVFLDVRDRSGIVQVVCVPAELDAASAALLDSIRSEFVVDIVGVVKKRGEKQINPAVPTGTIEILAKSVSVLAAAQTLPYEIDKDTSVVNEETRLQYRYLDLRSERVHRNITLRSQYVQACREYLFKNDFKEIETPYLTQSTPEGSRDFVIPSRMQAGKFFALPQSPQQYKQLLMVAGFERYFQVARCFRDEDPRADRGFEFTQIDLEMSFVKREDVMEKIEAMTIEAAEKLGFTLKYKPFPRITYKEAMEKYGADKFDMRTEEEKASGNILAYAWVIDFPFFEKTDEGGWSFTHNPFSAPLPQFVEDHLAGRNIENILTTQYDLVCNGYEIGGGSIRTHTPEGLRATYKIMGYSDEEVEDSIGHMLKAFTYGAPPHGGIALGVERTLMIMTNEKYVREVQAFPMTGTGNTAVMHAPAPLTQKQLDEYHIRVIEKSSKS